MQSHKYINVSQYVFFLHRSSSEPSWRMFRERPKKSESDEAQIIDIIIRNNNNQSPIPANQELLA